MSSTMFSAWAKVLRSALAAICSCSSASDCSMRTWSAASLEVRSDKGMAARRSADRHPPSSSSS